MKFEFEIPTPTSINTEPFKTKREVMIWLNSHNISNYEVHEDLSVDVDGEVDLYEKNLNELPVKFNTVTGMFNCSKNNLKSLKGCPHTINLHFHCADNPLESLEYLPKKVEGYLFFHGTPIENLENFSCDFQKHFYHSGTPIKGFEPFYTVDPDTHKLVLKITVTEFYNILSHNKLQKNIPFNEIQSKKHKI
jgi:hypothetical protein